MQYKSIPASIKDLDMKQGIICAYGSKFGNVDDGEDVVEPGAFTKSIQERGPSSHQPRIKHLWQHDTRSVLGVPSTLSEDAFGLYFESKIVPTALGHDVLLLYEAGAITEHSIGYDAVVAPYDRNAGVRRLKELILWEVSAVTWGMNSQTPVVAIKSLGGPDHLAERMARIDRMLHSADFHTEDVPLSLERLLKELQAVTDLTHPSQPTIVTSASTGAPTSGSRGHDDDMNRRRPRAAGLAPQQAAQQAQQAQQAPTRKAVDFTAALAAQSADDTLQDAWGDAFQAFVSAMSSAMWSARYQTLYGDDSEAGDAPDPAELPKTIISQFADAMNDLVDQSIAASFAPQLDDDGDSFLDPDGPDADDCDSGYMSADTSRRGRKEGRTLSADSHSLMTKALDMIGAGHKALSDFTKANAPATTPSADAGADESADAMNDGARPPSASDNVYDAGFGKSARTPTSIPQRRAGPPARTSATTTPTSLGAGALAAAVKGATHQSPQAATAATTDDDVARFSALFADMRQSRAGVSA